MKSISSVVIALAVVATSCASDSTESTVPGTGEPGAQSLPVTSESTSYDTPTTTTHVSPGSTEPSSDELTVSRASSLGEPQTELEAEVVRLWVSNQSFEDDPVAITIRIDGNLVVDDSFAVEGQHNWIAFDIEGLPPGEHALAAESDTGARTEGTFTLPTGESRWLVADYWYYPDDSEGRFFTLSESDEPVAFA